MERFIVVPDGIGTYLFEREQAKITANWIKVYEGKKPAALNRLGERDDCSDEMIG